MDIKANAYEPSVTEKLGTKKYSSSSGSFNIHKKNPQKSKNVY